MVLFYALTFFDVLRQFRGVERHGQPLYYDDLLQGVNGSDGGSKLIQRA